jgi:hypothetical protein
MVAELVAELFRSLATTFATTPMVAELDPIKTGT